VNDQESLSRGPLPYWCTINAGGRGLLFIRTGMLHSHPLLVKPDIIDYLQTYMLCKQAFPLFIQYLSSTATEHPHTR